MRARPMDIAARVVLACMLASCFAVFTTPAMAADPRHYTYYNPNPTFDGDWTGLTETTVGGTRTLTLARTVLWHYELGSGADLRSASRLADGGTLITDAAGRRVLEITLGGSVGWSYDASDNPDLDSPSGAASGSTQGSVLIADPGGRQVLEVARDKTVLWRHGVAQNPDLGRPTSARPVPGSDHVLITDTGAGRVIEVARDGSVVWSSDASTEPRDARRLTGGQTMISDESGHRVCIVNEAGDVVWKFGTKGEPGSDMTHLKTPTSADRLADGSVVISDTGNERVIRVSESGVVVDVYGKGGASDSDASVTPVGGLGGTAGGMLIADAAGDRLLEVGYASSGTYETPDLTFGMAGVNKWITQLLPDSKKPAGTSVQVSYSLNGGPWKAAGSGGDFTITDPVPSSYARFRVVFTTADPGLTPSLQRLDATFYLAKPSVYKPPKKGPGSGSGPTTTTAGDGTGSGSGSGSGTGTGVGSGTGGGSGTGTGTGTGTGVTAGGTGPKVVGENVPMGAASSMLSGWVLDEKAVGSSGGASAGGSLADPAGIVAAAILMVFAYGVGVSSPLLQAGLLAAVRPVKEFVMGSIHG